MLDDVAGLPAQDRGDPLTKSSYIVRVSRASWEDYARGKMERSLFVRAPEIDAVYFNFLCPCVQFFTHYKQYFLFTLTVQNARFIRYRLIGH